MNIEERQELNEEMLKNLEQQISNIIKLYDIMDQRLAEQQKELDVVLKLATSIGNYITRQ